VSRQRALLIGLIAVVVACGLLWNLRRNAASRPVSVDAGVPDSPARVAEALLSSDRADVEEPAPEERKSVELRSGAGDRKRPEEVPLWHGRVTDAETLAPIAGAVLESQPPTMGADSIGSDVRATGDETFESGEDGRFARVPVSGRIMRIRHSEYSRVVVKIDSGHDAVDRELVIPLARAATLEVVLRDGTGTPCSEWSIRVTAPSSDLVFPDRRGDFVDDVRDEEWMVPVDPSGRCEISGLASGPRLALSLHGCDQPVRQCAADVVLEPGERRTLEWDLGPLCRLTGTAVDGNGIAVAGLEVALYTATSSFYEVARTTTDAKGRFLFDALSPSTWWIMLAEWDPRGATLAATPRAQVAAEPLEFEVKSGEMEKEVTLHVHAGLFIRGTVVGLNGEPVARCPLSAWSVETNHSTEDETDRRGEFELGPLVPGEYRIQAEASGSRDRFAADAREVSAFAGDTGVVIELLGGGVIQGRTVDRSSGQPIAAWVAIQPDPRPEAQDWGTAKQSKADGRFVFEQRDPGKYHAFAWTEQGLVARSRESSCAPARRRTPWNSCSSLVHE
jgi:hypothetical protein